MDASISASFATLAIGAVFTRPDTAAFAVDAFGILDLWLSGKTVLDPTMGQANLLEVLVDAALEKGYALSELPLHNLFGVECNAAFHSNARAKFINKYHVDMSANFYRQDILKFDSVRADVLFGNPPWCNFSDLPREYKEFVKPFFLDYGLAPNKRKLLLGGSRIDIAALIIQKTITDNLIDNGIAVFFLPLSLFLNDGAHEAFRCFTAGNKRYALKAVYDFADKDVFGISARSGLALFEKKAAYNKEIPYFRYENEWKEYTAFPALNRKGSFLAVTRAKRQSAFVQITVPSESKPRQGINTCGANGVFIFTEYQDIDDTVCKVFSSGNYYHLPKKFIYPLITTKNFTFTEKPQKWILLPYNPHGKPLDELSPYPLLKDYFEKYRHVLAARKGVFIQTYIQRGLWWALLGVGPYSFQQYKIVWEAYGKKHFTPRLFEGSWQANQSLQAFIPCNDKKTALRILDKLQKPEVENFLRSSKMEGTMSWAQPGKISNMLIFTDG
ncbi:MAG: hypothetical protein LBB61_04080 [Treponema sp.]|nr:hypothetical protein [Treponema sp.]